MSIEKIEKLRKTSSYLKRSIRINFGGFTRSQYTPSKKKIGKLVPDEPEVLICERYFEVAVAAEGRSEPEQQGLSVEPITLPQVQVVRSLHLHIGTLACLSHFGTRCGVCLGTAAG